MRLRWVTIALLLPVLVAVPAVRAATNPLAICSAAKRKAVGKAAFDRMKCEASAAIRGTVDPQCIEHAEDRLRAGFAKAERKAPTYSCPAMGHADVLDEQVDAFVAAAALAASGVTMTTTTTTTTSTTTTFPACPGGGRQLSDRTGAQHCWYLGQVGSDCDTTCAAIGLSYDPATETFAGSGGDDSDCLVVLNRGNAALSAFLFRSQSLDCTANGLGGIGCFAIPPPAGCNFLCLSSFGRCAAPTTGSADSAPGRQRFCACK